jgi:hypothetical protein
VNLPRSYPFIRDNIHSAIASISTYGSTCNLFPEILYIIDLDTISYHKQCYKQVTRNQDRLMKLNSPVQSTSGRHYSPRLKNASNKNARHKICKQRVSRQRMVTASLTRHKTASNKTSQQCDDQFMAGMAIACIMNRCISYIA